MSKYLEKCEVMYLDYCNNFLTTSYFAEYYKISERTARYIIEVGRIEHSNNTTINTVYDSVMSNTEVDLT